MIEEKTITRYKRCFGFIPKNCNVCIHIDNINFICRNERCSYGMDISKDYTPPWLIKDKSTQKVFI